MIPRFQRWLVPHILVLVLATSVSASESEPAEDRGWRGAFEFGLLVIQSDQDSTTGNTRLLISKETELLEFEAAAQGAYGKTEDEVSTERYDATLNADYLPQARISPFVMLTYTRDLVKRIDRRLSAGPGVKWTFLREDPWKMSLSAALLYEYEELQTEPEHTDAALLSVRYKANGKLNDYAQIDHVTFFVPDLESPDVDYRIQTSTSLITNISKRLGVSTTIRDVYDNHPAAGVERNYLELSVSLVAQLGRIDE